MEELQSPYSESEESSKHILLESQAIQKKHIKAFLKENNKLIRGYIDLGASAALVTVLFYILNEYTQIKPEDNRAIITTLGGGLSTISFSIAGIVRFLKNYALNNKEKLFFEVAGLDENGNDSPESKKLHPLIVRPFRLRP